MNDPAPRPDPELLEAAFAVVRDGVADGLLPSGVLAVATASRTLRIEAFGPVQPDSIFAIASITKPIVAAAVMRLVERGRVLLNDPVARVLPEFAASGKEQVRLWHLLTHTSGLDEAQAQALHGRGASRVEIGDAVLTAPLLFRPGSRYAYNNVAFAVLARLIERLTGQDDVAYLREQVLARLGMVDTGYRPPESGRVAPVLDPPWPDERGRQYWMELAIPAGGLWSTAADLVRFGQACLRGGAPILSPAALGEMTRLQTDGIDEDGSTGRGPVYYGLGFAKVGQHGRLHPSPELRTPAGFGHGGATGTLLWVEPGLDLVFVFMTNRWGIAAPHAGRALNAAIAAFSWSFGAVGS